MTRMKTKRTTTKKKTVVSKKSNSNNKTVTAVSNKQVKMATGIYKVSHKYIVRKTINGVRTYASFTTFNKAKSYYKSL